jgi:biotin carboxylase
MSGHAIECRNNADNPNTFWPSPGHLTGLNLPDGIGIRADTAGYADWIVPPHGDSLLAFFPSSRRPLPGMSSLSWRRAFEVRARIRERGELE